MEVLIIFRHSYLLIDKERRVNKLVAKLQVLMQLYILFRGTEATWAFFNFMFIMMTLIAGASFYGFEIDKLGLTKGSSREGYVSTGVLAILWAILCFGLADKIYI